MDGNETENAFGWWKIGKIGGKEIKKKPYSKYLPNSRVYEADSRLENRENELLKKNCLLKEIN